MTKRTIAQSNVILPFGFGGICASENCNEETDNDTDGFGIQYDNISVRREVDFLTGEDEVTVKEIEVFEIADETALPQIERNV
jgi:hypothetical protein